MANTGPAGARGPYVPPKSAAAKAAAPKAAAPKASKPARAGRGGGGGLYGSVLKMTKAQLAAESAPILAQIKAEQATNLAKAREQMGFAKAAAALMQQAAPNVQAGYTNAANSDAGYAKGLGNIAQGALDKNQQVSNDFLAKMGTPTEALGQAPDVGGIAYGTNGYIPGTALQREGAAWGAQAQLAPGYELAKGQLASQATLSNDPNLVSLRNELAKIQATEPDVYNGLVKQMQEQMYRNATLGLRGRELASMNSYRQQSLSLRAQEIQAQQQYHQASLGLQAEGLALRSRKDSAAIRNAILKGNQPDASLSKVYGYIVDHNGDPILSHGKKIPVVKSSSSSSSGLPPWVTPGKKGRANPNGAALYIEPAAYKTLSKPARTIIDLANEYIGAPYVWGGESPKGFDCSGFAQYLYGKAGISIPRTTYTQWTAANGRPVGKRQLQPGDLVFYKGSDSIVQGGKVLPGHVGIYIGHGKVIDAYGTGYGVRVDGVFSPAMGGYMGARRFL